jgi:hypothetical protein
VFPALIFGSSSISVSWFLFLLTPPRELMYGVISINGVRSRRFYRPQNRGERIHNVVVSPYGAAMDVFHVVGPHPTPPWPLLHVHFLYFLKI